MLQIMFGGHRAGKHLRTVALTIQKSLESPGKECWIVGNETTDIYITGKLDRTVPTDSLFAKQRTFCSER